MQCLNLLKKVWINSFLKGYRSDKGFNNILVDAKLKSQKTLEGGTMEFKN